MITKTTNFLNQICALVLFFSSTTIFSQTIVTVTSSNLHGWVKEEQHLGKINFANGPSKPPFNKGSLEFYAPENGANRRFVRMRNTAYSGLLLSSITHLSYSTFVQKANSDLDAPFLVLQVDGDGDGVEDTHMAFNLKFEGEKYLKGRGIAAQGPVKKDIWQTWDALKGAWFTGPVKTPDSGAPLYTIADYVKEHPNARIINDSTGGGIRLQAGGVPMANNFVGNADAFTIGVNGKTTVYDFELGRDAVDARTEKNEPTVKGKPRTGHKRIERTASVLKRQVQRSL
jgi:hypothetical protein